MDKAPHMQGWTSKGGTSKEKRREHSTKAGYRFLNIIFMLLMYKSINDSLFVYNEPILGD